MGGPYQLKDVDAIQALSWEGVRDIAKKFNRLNPYNPALVPELLKIEDVNYVGSDPKQPQRQLYGYAVSAKRYALYCQNGRDISIVKESGHGLGYLFPPKEGYNEEIDAPQWIVEAWEWRLRKELGLSAKDPTWLGYPAMMRIALTSPNVAKPDPWLLLTTLHNRRSQSLASGNSCVKRD